MFLFNVILFITSINNVPSSGVHLPPDPSRFKEYKVNEIQTYFNEFINYYNHKFSYKVRNEFYKTFENNVIMINTMNAEDPTHTKYRINEFTHLTLKEFTDLYTGFNDTELDHINVKDFVYEEVGNPDPAYLTTNIAWVSPIAKHQVSGCKNSYVFSAIGNIEAQIERSYSKYTELSEQQGYDCEEAGSCQYGGLPHLVMEALMEQGGLYNSEDYPYRKPTVNGTKFCKWVKSQTDFKVTGVHHINVNNETGLMGAVYLHGPVVTAIHVSESVKNYHSGVLDPSDCNKKPNHAMLLVGYGMGEEKIPFWELKNSWGINWGQMGYMRLVRGKKACNIGTYVATTTVGSVKNLNSSSMPSIKIAPEEMVTLDEYLKVTHLRPSVERLSEFWYSEDKNKTVETVTQKLIQGNENNFNSSGILSGYVVVARQMLKQNRETNNRLRIKNTTNLPNKNNIRETPGTNNTKTTKCKRFIDLIRMEAGITKNVFPTEILIKKGKYEGKE